MVRLPNNTQRTVLVGRTGTGKTVAGLWHLSNYNLDRPWVLINFKNDEHIDSIEKAQHIDFDYIPNKKDDGLFVIHPIPMDAEGTIKEKSPLEIYLWKLWERENVGIFCDEALIVGSNNAFDACLTQGRSKHIPMIICTQRPVWITRFAFSEADFVQAFHLNDESDRERVEQFTPLDVEDFDLLGKHESFYYDISENNLVRFKPVPNMDAIRGKFDEKLRRKRIRL